MLYSGTWIVPHGSSICPLAFGCCEFSHVIFLMLRKKVFVNSLFSHKWSWIVFFSEKGSNFLNWHSLRKIMSLNSQQFKTRGHVEDPKSLQRSPVVGDFYGTEIEIWAGFGLNGQLSCLHSFKLFRTMKPSYISNEMT